MNCYGSLEDRVLRDIQIMETWPVMFQREDSARTMQVIHCNWNFPFTVTKPTNKPQLRRDQNNRGEIFWEGFPRSQHRGVVQSGPWMHPKLASGLGLPHGAVLGSMKAAGLNGLWRATEAWLSKRSGEAIGGTPQHTHGMSTEDSGRHGWSSEPSCDD